MSSIDTFTRQDLELGHVNYDFSEDPRRIVVLQAGWVMVGRMREGREMCHLNDAYVVRKWGTKRGLGEIAIDGPTKETILDPVGRSRFKPDSYVCTLDCEEEPWIKVSQPQLWDPHAVAEYDVEFGPSRIFVLHSGWVVVGRFFVEKPTQYCLRRSSVVRRWGTTQGLGEIAALGPTASTILDPSGTVRFHPETYVVSYDADDEKWEKHCW